MFEIVPVDPRTDDRWLRLARSPLGSVFTSPPWITAVAGTYGFVPHARIVLDATGVPVAGFAWIVVDDLRGERLLSLPFSDRAEPLCDSAGTWRALARDAIDTGLPLTVRCFADSPVARGPLVPTGAVAWHGTPLGGSLDEIEGRLDGELRRNIRLAQRRGVKVVASTDLWAVREFHRLHVTLRKRKYRLLAQPVEFMDRVWHEFSRDDAVVTFLAYCGDEVIAAALYLVWNDTLYYKFSASDQDRLMARPNQAIGWAAIEWATQRGLALLDWGVSDLDQPGLVRYKRRWGGVESRIVTWKSPGAGAPDTELGPLLRGLTELLTEESVPDPVAARAGALLYRYFC